MVPTGCEEGQSCTLPVHLTSVRSLLLPLPADYILERIQSQCLFHHFLNAKGGGGVVALTSP